MGIAEISKTSYNSDVYEPAEDSFALVDSLVADRCMEIGSGSGYCICSLGLILRELGITDVELVATDVSSHAVAATTETLRAHEVVGEVVQTDLWGALEDRVLGKVGVLLFNPPYVPTPDAEVGGSSISAAWAGGDRGRRVIDRVLPRLGALLAPGGRCYMVAVNENEPYGIVEEMKGKGLAAEVVLKRGADEELLHIVRIARP